MPPPTASVVRVCLLLASLTASACSACYFPNGTDVTAYQSQNEAYGACHASAEASMCCRINVSGGDHCRSDGLCDSPNHEYIWRESCTDPTWKSPHCQKLCLDYAGLDPWGQSMAGINVDVTQCDDRSFCCGAATNGSTCCAEGRGVWMVDGKETSVNPNKTSTAAATSSATSIKFAAETTKSPTASRHPNAGAITGGVVGGAAAFLLLLGLSCWFLRRRRGNFNASPSASMRESSSESTIIQQKNLAAELPPNDRPIEADSIPRMEMDGGARQEWKDKRSSPDYRGPAYF